MASRDGDVYVGSLNPSPAGSRLTPVVLPKSVSCFLKLKREMGKGTDRLSRLPASSSIPAARLGSTPRILSSDLQLHLCTLACWHS